MKKISKRYYLAAGILFFWAAWDFYHYAAAGRELVTYYADESIIQQLIYNSLFQGTVKVLIGCLLIFIGYRESKKKTQHSSLTAITWLLSLTVLMVWGVSMCCITSLSAEYAAARYMSSYENFMATLSTTSFSSWLGKGYDLKYANHDVNRMWETVDIGGKADSFAVSRVLAGGDSGFLDFPDSDKAYSSAAIYDEEGNFVAGSWEDFFYFEYLTEEQWTNKEERLGNHARALFHRNMLTETGKKMVSDSSLFYDASAMRFTGSFDGVEFTPKTIEYIDYAAFDKAARSQSKSYTVSGVVQEYDLPWTILYEDPEAVPSGTEMVTLYSDWFDVCYNQLSPEFSYKGKQYDNLNAFVSKIGLGFPSGWENTPQYEGWDLVIPSINYCCRVGDQTYFSPDKPLLEDGTQIYFYIVSAVYCSPWRTAWSELRYVYLLTFLLSAAFVFFVRCMVKRKLISTARLVGEAMEKGMEESDWRPPEESRGWRESQLLEEGFVKCRDAFQKQKNEITRLHTALEYAKKAEDDRRQMTSNIAHELKTPLAIIHSYAEGLKEHTAEEKREKYIDVILSEAERTDNMVLEMLDLSRLEAGRVKLSRDDFSLISLTQSIFDKLEIAVQDKGLQIEFSFPDDFTVTADESRIAQVVENFATNAIKYTPAGGRVKVKIEAERGKTLFSIENEASPLSYEALTKVWEAFYRTDESRSGEGTGLGLAIAKSIIELHGGKCWVRNTETGVEFGFAF